ncbi:MAG: hypothetical protein EZS28_000864 [Streblomastix strix]|uniref:Uncharacterized protein n=1 Tax=Streblomastix strix TaxID=222440 RepID=A0A5J4X906_9EUKA|nr:MAG: hypothetical protein EZS28_000864 [Streblomastix strix]
MDEFYIHLTCYNQDIGQLQADVQVINSELARQTHFRGQFTTNDEILVLANPAIGDYTYSAEDLLVWDYDGSQWVEIDKIVPDQVTATSDANPLIDSGTGVVGTSTEYSRGDHQHPLNTTTSIHPHDSASGTRGQIYSQNVNKSQTETIVGGKTFKNDQFQLQPQDSTKTSFAGVTCGTVQINSISQLGFDDGCSRTTNGGAIDGQWVIYTPSINATQSPQSFIIVVASQASDLTRGLQISADGNTLTFNGRVI